MNDCGLAGKPVGTKLPVRPAIVAFARRSGRGPSREVLAVIGVSQPAVSKFGVPACCHIQASTRIPAPKGAIGAGDNLTNRRAPCATTSFGEYQALNECRRHLDQHNDRGTLQCLTISTPEIFGEGSVKVLRA